MPPSELAARILRANVCVPPPPAPTPQGTVMQKYMGHTPDLTLRARAQLSPDAQFVAAGVYLMHRIMVVY